MLATNWVSRRLSARLLAAAAIIAAGTVPAFSIDLREPTLRGPDISADPEIGDFDLSLHEAEEPPTRPRPVRSPKVQPPLPTNLPPVGADLPSDRSDDVRPETEAKVAKAGPKPVRPAPEPVSRARIVPAAVMAAPALRGTASERDLPAPDMQALTNAIPTKDRELTGLTGGFREDYTLSGPRRAEAIERSLPNASRSMTVLGRDLTGKRNPRSSTIVVLGR